jgi:probable HAF family extracellular repeat protein
MTDIGGLPGASDSGASAINNSGQVVGNSRFASGGHAFLYSGGTMIDLGALPGGTDSDALGINNSGQVVGEAYTASLVLRAFLYSGGTMTDLNNLVALPGGAYLTSATGINDLGQIAANGSNNHAYLLTPVSLPSGNSSLSVSNPFAPYAASQQAPPTQNLPLLSPATSLAADGESAVVLSYKSTSPQPVTFTLTATGVPPGKAVGALGPYDPSYLANPNPPQGASMTYVTTPVVGPFADGSYVFLALLWAPNAMPTPQNSYVNLAVTASQNGQGRVLQASIALECSSFTGYGRVLSRPGSLPARTGSMTGFRACTHTI